jgi:hypothetical protein
MSREDELLRRWMRAGERLRELDQERFERVLGLAETYVSIYEKPLEDEDTFLARLRRASGPVEAN